MIVRVKINWIIVWNHPSSTYNFRYKGFPIVWWGHDEDAPPPILQYFSNLHPIKTDTHRWAHLPLKNEAPPSEKQPLSPH